MKEVECQIEYTGEATGRASFLVAGKPLGLKASSLIGNRRGNEGCHGVEEGVRCAKPDAPKGAGNSRSSEVL